MAFPARLLECRGAGARKMAHDALDKLLDELEAEGEHAPTLRALSERLMISRQPLLATCLETVLTRRFATELTQKELPCACGRTLRSWRSDPKELSTLHAVSVRPRQAPVNQDQIMCAASMSNSDDHFRKLERLYASAPINRFFEPTLRVSEGRAQVVAPIRPDLFHAAHAVHGSVYFKALDDAAFFAVNSMVTDVFVLTVTFNVFLLRPITDGVVTANGKLVHMSRSLFVAEAELVDQQSRLLARGSGSFMRSNILLSSDVGYE